jgi:N6-L-threonylcarbamoyladenine synthase
MRILSIETSCDETGLAILDAKGGPARPRVTILKEVVASQIKIHEPWGGVVPNLAKREHIRNLPILYKKIFGVDEKKLWKSIDLIAVTAGPGLEPALWTGINFAKDLAKQWQKPLIGANHMEGHLYSVLLQKNGVISNAKYPISNGIQEVRRNPTHNSLPARTAGTVQSGGPTTHLFPAIALIVSGGHTLLLRMDSIISWKKLGETRDDAVGEAFDKVARMLDLPYPGGPQISRLALKGDPQAIEFPQPMLHSKDYDFSFSGLKTAVLYYLKDHPAANAADVAASFEHAAVTVLVQKTFRAVRQFDARSIWLSGGVAANKLLRKTLAANAKKSGIPLLTPDQKHSTDNAAMIGAAAYMSTFRKKKYSLVARGDMEI